MMKFYVVDMTAEAKEPNDPLYYVMAEFRREVKPVRTYGTFRRVSELYGHKEKAKQLADDHAAALNADPELAELAWLRAIMDQATNNYEAKFRSMFEEQGTKREFPRQEVAKMPSTVAGLHKTQIGDLVQGLVTVYRRIK